MNMDFKSAKELLDLCEENQLPISEVMRQRECLRQRHLHRRAFRVVNHIIVGHAKGGHQRKLRVGCPCTPYSDTGAGKRTFQ